MALIIIVLAVVLETKKLFINVLDIHLRRMTLVVKRPIGEVISGRNYVHGKDNIRSTLSDNIGGVR